MKLFNSLKILFFCALVFISPRSIAGPLEYEIKAAFIYNFAKFVEWVDRSSLEELDVLPLCILGKDPFGKAIDKLEGRKVQNLSLHVKRINSIGERAGCRILFVSKSETDSLSILIDVLDKEKGILTISDIKGFAQEGGVIELVLSHNKVRFMVNIEVARDSELYLSSKILRLANVVGDDRDGH